MGGGTGCKAHLRRVACKTCGHTDGSCIANHGKLRLAVAEQLPIQTELDVCGELSPPGERWLQALDNGIVDKRDV